MVEAINLHGIDWKLIFSFEGHGQITDDNAGFVPRMTGGAPFQNSGVSFELGVDLGHLTQNERYYLAETDKALFDKIELYIGVLGVDAVELLNDNPISLTHAELVQIFAIKVQGIIPPIKRDYFMAVPHAERIAKIDGGATTIICHNADELWDLMLTREQRTILGSVAWQYGYLPSRTPKFWKLCVKRDWRGVVAELRNFGDDFDTRRGLEADYLERSLT